MVKVSVTKMKKTTDTGIWSVIGVAGAAVGAALFREIRDTWREYDEEQKDFEASQRRYACQFAEATGVSFGKISKSIGNTPRMTHDSIIDRWRFSFSTRLGSAEVLSHTGETFANFCRTIVDIYQNGDFDAFRMLAHDNSDGQRARAFSNFSVIIGYDDGTPKYGSNSAKRGWHAIGDYRCGGFQAFGETPEKLRDSMNSFIGYAKFQKSEDRVWWLPFTW